MASNFTPADHQIKQIKHAPTSRSRPRPADNEEAAAVLNLGEFQDSNTLSLSEARLLIDAVITRRKDSGLNNVKEAEGEVLSKTQEYLDNFARLKSQAPIEDVSRMLEQHGSLEAFEKSQLATLFCENAEEAKVLIPSLASKIDDTDLQNLLNSITNMRHMTA